VPAKSPKEITLIGKDAWKGDLFERRLCADAGTSEIVKQLILQPLDEGVG
jgi:hypothetical protein